MTPPEAAAPLLEVRDLVRHFRGGAGLAWLGRPPARAVDGVSLSVRPRETLGLVGESGCGKTTTARLMLRLLEPTRGAVRFDGADVTKARGARLKGLRREMQMVFQDPQSSLNPCHTIASIVARPLIVHGVEPDRSRRHEAVRDLLVQVGLDPRQAGRYPHELSDGQRQRVGIARALALRPRLLVADEPVSSLDVSVQAQILNLLREAQRELGLTMVFITHDLAVVRHMCDRVAVMYLGKVVEEAPAEQLFADPRHPYTRALLSAVPVPDPRVRRRREPLAGDVPSAAAPPPGCRFHPRCPRAQEVCAAVEPPLEPKHGGGIAACHFPLARGAVSRTATPARSPARGGRTA